MSGEEEEPTRRALLWKKAAFALSLSITGGRCSARQERYIIRCQESPYEI